MESYLDWLYKTEANTTALYKSLFSSELLYIIDQSDILYCSATIVILSGKGIVCIWSKDLLMVAGLFTPSDLPATLDVTTNGDCEQPWL